MPGATLTITRRPDWGRNVKVYLIDCPHGTTTAVTVGALPAPDAAVVYVLLNRHDAEEKCDCTAELRARYGVAEVSARVRR